MIGCQWICSFLLGGVGKEWLFIPKDPLQYKHAYKVRHIVEGMDVG
jgi:hypothetical protein